MEDAVSYLRRGVLARLPSRAVLDQCAKMYGSAGWDSAAAQDKLVDALNLDDGGVAPDEHLVRFVTLYVHEIDAYPNAREDQSERFMELAAEMISAADFSAKQVGFGGGDSCDGGNGAREAVYEFEDFEGKFREVVVQVSAHLSDMHLQVWESGFFLFECILSGLLDVRNLRVVEIGAGTGFSAAALHIAGAACAVLTDYKPEAVFYIELNLAKNALDGFARAELLDVEQCSDDRVWEQTLDADVLLGADITFDPKLATAVVDTYRRFLGHASGRCGYLATTVRSAEMMQTLADQLARSGLEVEDLSTAAATQRRRVFDYVRIHRADLQGRSSVQLLRLTAS